MTDPNTLSRSVAPPHGASVQVTLWYRKGDKGYEFNHLEDGHSSNDKPTPKTAAHGKAWASGEWVSEHAWLDASLPAKVLHDSQNELARKVRTGQISVNEGE
jgi:hypothetical protein